MHIIFIFSTDIFYGIASHVFGLAKRLRDRGHEATFITRGDWRGAVEFEHEGFKVIKAPFYPFYPLHVHLHGIFVRKAIEKLVPQPDVIHLHSPLVAPVPKEWPIVTTFHTPMLIDTAYVENVSLKTFLIKLMGKTMSYYIEKKLLKISDAVITVSQGVADELKTYYGYVNRIYPIINVVDINFYKPANYFSKGRKLLYVGRLAYRKGLFDIVKSAKYVVKKYPYAKYVLVGTGPLESKIKRMIVKNNLEQNFELYGETRNPTTILRYYQDAYAVLVPSYYEGFPMVLAEAMACGKPIIATTAGFGKGILEDRLNALLIQPKSTEELTKAIITLLSSEELCKKLGAAARKTAEERMNQEKNTDEVMKVYNQAIKMWRQSR